MTADRSMGVDPDCCVEIFGAGTYGSGYALTRSSILTAWHVVGAPSGGVYDTLRARRLAEARAGGTTKHEVELAWHDRSRDLAVLRLVGTPDWPGVTLPDFAQLADPAAIATEAGGFPRFRASGSIRDYYPARGEASRSPKTGTVRVSIPFNTPRVAAEWSGFSGSPVFVEGGLIGVVSDVETAVDGTLVVAVIGDVVRGADFVRALGVNGPIACRRIAKASAASLIAPPRDAAALEISTPERLALLTRFFALCVNERTADRSGPLELATFSQRLPRGATAWIRLRGPQGAGKTTFLAALHNVVVADERDGRGALFVDAGRLRAAADPEAALGSAMEELRRALRAGKHVLIVDGLIERDPVSEKLCGRLCELSFDGIEAVVWSMSTPFETRFEEITIQRRQVLAQRSIAIDLTLALCEPAERGFATYLRDFAAIHVMLSGDAPPDAAKLDRFEKRARRFAASSELDQHTLSLIFRSLSWSGDVKNQVGLLETYCIGRMLGDRFDAHDTDTDAVMDEASWLAYRVGVSAIYEGPGPPNLDILQSQRTGRAWDLVHEHTNIRDFLIAWHLQDRVLDAVDDDAAARLLADGVLNYDFTQTVNGFVKRLVTRDESTSRRILINLKRLASLAGRSVEPSRSEIWLAYLVGRFAPNANPSPRAILNGLEKSSAKRSATLPPQARLTALALTRTIAVSAIRLGDKERGAAFLLDLLDNAELAAVDRGYHRLYYGDCTAYLEHLPGCYLDDRGTSWARSFRHLRLSIGEAIPEAIGEAANAEADAEALNQDVQHKILTLVLFVQSRLGIDTPEEVQARTFASGVIPMALQREGWPELVADYLTMMREELSVPDAGAWRTVLELYRLKAEPRRGWLVRGVSDRFDPDRVESVADHSHLASLLALLLLPERLTTEGDYNKADVVLHLIGHDIAEAFTGDIIGSRLPDPDRVSARDLERRVHRFLRWQQTHDGLNGTASVIDRCLAFARTDAPMSLTVRVARDLDRLENLIQLHLYRASAPQALTEDVFRGFAEALRRDITVPEIRSLAASFVRWADLRHDRLRPEPRRFFEKRFVVADDRIGQAATR